MKKLQFLHNRRSLSKTYPCLFLVCIYSGYNYSKRINITNVCSELICLEDDPYISISHGELDCEIILSFKSIESFFFYIEPYRKY